MTRNSLFLPTLAHAKQLSYFEDLNLIIKSKAGLLYMQSSKYVM
jgi:hypothetical protein